MKQGTLIPGDGVGPEITNSLQKVFKAANIPLEFDIVLKDNSTSEKDFFDTMIKSILVTKVALKGPLATPIGSGFRSHNVALRRYFDLYCNIRPIKTESMVQTPFKNVDLVIFRENTEDLYIGIEKKINNDEMHAIKVITRQASERIALKAFEYAQKNKIAKVTVVTKANIMKLTDGLFLDSARKIARDFPNIELEETLIDNLCMQLVMHPENYQLILTENLYGDILSDLCAGLVGGLGLIPGANIGSDIAIFEPVHGSAPDIAGKDRANPIALIRSAVMMLEYLNLQEQAELITKSLEDVLQNSNYYTRDIGGSASTSEFTERLINIIKQKMAS
ncbi:isocitrate/isopropylmalate dehydrogenase family protein [Aerococcaceae bacterium DSM 111020]|nr:isocitrate/isopropylmalate dehydrogenase family protein [Aerococcaceae bacterium DSM 111020]